jgi:serine protease Do
MGLAAGTFLAGAALQGQNPAPTVIPAEMTSYRDVVRRVLPAVVSIEGRVKAKPHVSDQQPRRRSRGADSQLPDELRRQIPEELRRFFEDMPQGQMEQQDEVPQVGFGSGFIVDPKGVILTNWHVVGGADQVEIQLQDGTKYTSKDIHGDRKSDLAIVRVNAKQPLPYLELGDSDQMEIGDRVLAVGAPFGLTGSVTAGIVSAKGRAGLSVNMYEDFIQTDAAINPGNSGGPLVNLAGQVIGIDSAIKSRTGGFQGVGLAIASNLARSIMKALDTEGVVHRGYLGIQIQDLNPDDAPRLGVHERGGVVVNRVFDGAPAAKAGIQAGDIITRLAGKPVKDGRELQRVVAGMPLHKPVDVEIVRDEKPQTLRVTIEEQPAEYGTTADVRRPGVPREEHEAINLEQAGIEVRDMNAELANQLDYKETTRGALVTHVEPGSAAADAGLTRGMVITKVDKQPVKSAKGLRELLNKDALAKGPVLQVQSPQGGVRYLVLKAESVK